MADHIPFISSQESNNLVKRYYSDSAVVRVPLFRVKDWVGWGRCNGMLWLDSAQTVCMT